MPTDSDQLRPYALQFDDPHWFITYKAMAGPCEVQIECQDASEAEHLASLAYIETARIEAKLSRYHPESLVSIINQSAGQYVSIDSETSQLLSFTAAAYNLSAGKFDITSGVLRRAWRFDGSEVRPDQELISRLLPLVGWEKVDIEPTRIRLRPGMEIDLGGLGKEYAADRVAQLLHSECGHRLMVNFGGDIRAIGATSKSTPWRIGIESPAAERQAIGEIALRDGGVATSGDARRYCIVDGQRLSHILDPRTGWPVANPPQSVTVLADSCTEAGFFSTWAMLHGEDAEQFLEEQKLPHHCIRLGS